MAKDDSDQPFLDFASCNDSASTTIIFMHGVSANGSNWDLVEPHLKACHILAPSLFTEHSLKLARNIRDPSANLDSGTQLPHGQARYVEMLAALVRRYG